MTVRDWLKSVTGVARLDAELILAEVLGVGREKLHAEPEMELSEELVARAEAMLTRRAGGEPLAYILGRKEFYGREFVVTPDVLIPRPETEEVVEVVIASSENGAGAILDVGTGSGAIGVTLALELPGVEVTAVDVSPEALGVARTNAERLGANNISFLQSDLLQGLVGAHRKPYNVIVANLPYVDKGWAWNGSELGWEPSGALFAGDGGLGLIEQLICEVVGMESSVERVGAEFLTPDGILVLEADPSQHGEILRFAGDWGFTGASKGFAVVLTRSDQR